jgi:hypothetical protein
MPKNVKLTVERITVTPDSRPCGAKSVFEQKFLIEKNAKNQAYLFIIQSGLMREFRDFCVSFRSADPFDECINAITNK